MTRVLAVLLCVLFAAAAPAAEPEDPAHNELRALRDALVAALKKNDVEAMLAHLHPNVVVTWQNAQVSRGHAGVRDYLKRMLEGPERIVEGFDTDVTVDELTILYGGDTGIAFGGAKDRFQLAGDRDFTLDSRWTATLVRENDRWLVSAVHTSSNLFDNPLTRAAMRTTGWAAAGALLAGLLAGWFARSRRRPVL